MDAVSEAARAHDLDRYLAALLAPRATRPDLLAVAAFMGELARIPRIVTEPTIGEIRLQWWHDTLESLAAGAESGNPVADALAVSVRRHALPLALLRDAVEARLFELYADPLTDEAALRRYLEGTEVAGFRLAARILGVPETPAMQAAVSAAGEAFGIARALLHLPLHRARGHWPLPLSWPEVPPPAAEGEDGVASQSASAIEAPLARGLAEARSRLTNAREMCNGGSPGLIAAVLPCALVEPYLGALERSGRDAATSVVDISPIGRVWGLWRAHRRRAI